MRCCGHRGFEREGFRGGGGKLEELSGRPRWDMKECDF